jgi:hypothetical protein
MGHVTDYRQRHLRCEHPLRSKRAVLMETSDVSSHPALHKVLHMRSLDLHRRGTRRLPVHFLLYQCRPSTKLRAAHRIRLQLSPILGVRIPSPSSPSKVTHSVPDNSRPDRQITHEVRPDPSKQPIAHLHTVSGEMHALCF